MFEEPTFITGGEFRLFGVLHRPSSPNRQGVGVLFIPPFAEEKKGAHRLLVDLARTLCRQGLPVLRFDFRGTGDSEGTFSDFTLAGALADARLAMAFLREQASVERIGLVGVRLGGTLAAHLAQEAQTCSAWLALWEPIVSGRRYVQMNFRQRRIRALMTAAEGRRAGVATATRRENNGVPPVRQTHAPAPSREGYDFDGYWITPTLHQELEALTFPAPVEGRTPPAVLAISVNAAGRVSQEVEALAAAYRAVGTQVKTTAVSAEPFWSLQDPVPLPLLTQATAEWVQEVGSSKQTPRHSGQQEAPAAGRDSSQKTEPIGALHVNVPHKVRTALAETVVEEALVFTHEGKRLVGVLSLPASSGSAPPVGIVALHGWSGYRIGPHGILTELMRRAAALGYACLRFDFRGRGDSEGEMEEATRASMIADGIRATEVLRERVGCQQVVLAGMCAGSQVAIGVAAMGGRADGLMLWSAPVSEQETEKKAVAAKRRHFLGEYARKLFRAATWRKLVTGKLRPRRILQVLSGRAGLAAADDRTVDLQAARLFAHFAGPVLLLYGTHDPMIAVALPYYQQLLQGGQSHVTLATIEGANHSFYGTHWKEEVLERSLAWLQQEFPLSDRGSARVC